MAFIVLTVFIIIVSIIPSETDECERSTSTGFLDEEPTKPFDARNSKRGAPWA